MKTGRGEHQSEGSSSDRQPIQTPHPRRAHQRNHHDLESISHTCITQTAQALGHGGSHDCGCHLEIPTKVLELKANGDLQAHKYLPALERGKRTWLLVDKQLLLPFLRTQILGHEGLSRHHARHDEANAQNTTCCHARCESGVWNVAPHAMHGYGHVVVLNPPNAVSNVSR